MKWPLLSLENTDGISGVIPIGLELHKAALVGEDEVMIGEELWDYLAENYNQGVTDFIDS